MLEAIIEEYDLGAVLCRLREEELHRTSPIAIDDNLDVRVLQSQLSGLVTHLLHCRGGRGYLQPMTLSLIATGDDCHTEGRGQQTQ